MATKKSAATKGRPRGNQSFLWLLGLGLVIGAGIILYVVNSKPPAVTFNANEPLPPAQGYVIGSDSAPVEITEFGDFECPNCGHFATITEPDVRTRIVATGLARFRFMDFPFEEHPNTMFAHNAAACANAQGKFWEMHDRIYEGQPEWGSFGNPSLPNAAKFMKLYAKGLGLDTKAFNDCFDARKFQGQIVANQKEGVKRGVGSTPTFFIGHRMVTAAQPYDVIKALVDSAAAEAKKTPPSKASRDSAGTKQKAR